MRTFLVVCVAVVVLVSGCAGRSPAGSGPSAPVDAPTDPTPVFEGPFLAGTYANGEKESFIAVSADGRSVLTCAHGEFRHSAYMYASEDGGVTWRTLTASPDPAVSGDCEVAISGQGVWAFLHSTVAGATIASTADQGRTWNVNFASAIPLGGMADRPFLEYVDERLLLTMQPGPLEPGGIGVTYSDDHGKSWSVPTVVARGEDDRTHVKNGGIVVSSDGATVRIPITRSIEAASGLANLPAQTLFAVSRDRGARWTLEEVMAPGALDHFPAAAHDGGGNLYWVYPKTSEMVEDLFLVISHDDGATWSEPKLVANETMWGRPWVHGRSDASMDLLWQRVGEGDAGHLVLTRILANGTISSETILGPLPDFLEYAEVTHDPSGRAFVSASEPGETSGRVELYIERAPPT